jgi:hypothetical protein
MLNALPNDGKFRKQQNTKKNVSLPVNPFMSANKMDTFEI